MGKLKIYRKSVEISEGIFQDAIAVKKTNTAICYFTNNDDKEKYLKLFESAPEMLEILENIIKEKELGIVSGIDSLKIKELIKKAT